MIPSTKRAGVVLALMGDPDKPYRIHENCTVMGADYTKDGEWFWIGLLPNIARKTIDQLLEAGAIEPKPGDRATGYWRLYRLVGRDEWLRQDYGDLWVSGAVSLTAYFERFSRAISNALGSPFAFILAVLLVLIWAAAGPFFDWNEQHQLLINTGTTIATFLMLFLLQSTQNRDTAAFHVKLDEILAAIPAARTGLGQAEELGREELEGLRAEMVRRAREE